MISRKMSSPSRPASQALMTSSTSLRASSFLMVRIRSLRPFFGRYRNSSGRIGSVSRVQRLYFSSTSSGGSNSNRCPTAKVTMKSSFSK